MICLRAVFFIISSMQTTGHNASPDILIILFAIPGFFVGPIIAAIIYSRYRNQRARHSHERETEVTMSNLQKSDIFQETLKKYGSNQVPNENSGFLEGKSTRQDGASDLVLDMFRRKSQG